MKLAAARIFVDEFAVAGEFYENALGLRVKARSPDGDYIVFDAQGCDLVVEHVARDAPQDERVLVGRFTGLSFAVTHIGSLCQTLAGRGVPFIAPPQRQAWGGTLATLRDPAGNQVQLVEYPRSN